MTKPYVVVLGTDFSEHATRALFVALKQAQQHAPAQLHVVHVSLLTTAHPGLPTAAMVGFPVAPMLSLDEQRQMLVAYLERELGRAPASEAANVRVIAHVLTEVPSLGIVTLAQELEADLIVVGSHGAHGVARWLMGSVAERVVRQAPCPVMVVPPPAERVQVPTIEPPCPRCVDARQASTGTELWCEQHRERHGRRHTYFQTDRVGRETNMPLVVREG
jgi:nucleotide-binding universal stress UspA family protein